MIRWAPFREILLARMREALREPEIVFWAFFFPLLLSLALGIAFRNKPPEKVYVAIERGPGAEGIRATLSADERFMAEVASPDEGARQLRLGKAAIVIAAGSGLEYRYDPTRPDSVLARTLVDDAIQRAAGRKDARPPTEKTVSEPGARYIDFLIPGLIGMNLMSAGMWGVGFAIVDMRTRKLLKRLVATPMRKSEFLAAMISSRFLFMAVELTLLLAFGRLVFGVEVRGSLLAPFLLGIVGALTFASLGLLIATRAQRIETISGLMNLVMMPMFIFSGTFFSSERFPDYAQPFIQALPLTLLNDALRAVINEGASIASQGLRLGGLGLWMVICFTLSLRLFRWS